MHNHLLLIDGSALLSSCFFGNLPMAYKLARTDEEKDLYLDKLLQSPDGQYTNGVFTMLSSMLNVIKKQKPTHIAVAWDLTKESTFRKKMYPEYKGQRKNFRAELGNQFPLAQEVLKEMGISEFVFSEYEADDIIGTIARKFENDIKVTIWTKDQDSLQLIDENIRVWLITSKCTEMYLDLEINTKLFNIPTGVFEFTPSYIEDYYGIAPIQIIDKKAIEGDPSDNIPGVSGVGEKSVIPLLKEFKTVEGIYDFIENSSEKEIKEMFKLLGITRSPLSKLIEESETKLVGKKAALLCKQLTTIKCDIPELQNISLDSLKLNLNKAGMRAIFEKLGFSSLLRTMEK